MVESEPKKMQLFHRLKDFPMMASVCTYIQATYEETKTSEMFGELIVKAEQILCEAIEKLEPLAGKMEKHIAAIDDLAIKGLEKVEEYFPITKKQPGEVKEVLLAYAEDLKNSEHLRVVIKALLFLATEGTKLFVELLIRFAKGKLAMEILLKIVDYLLPPLKDEKASDSSCLPEKFKDYFAKISNRISYYKKHLLSKSSELSWEDIPLVNLPATLYGWALSFYYEFAMGFLLYLLVEPLR